jgi:hypothetical protein
MESHPSKLIQGPTNTGDNIEKMKMLLWGQSLVQQEPEKRRGKGDPLYVLIGQMKPFVDI